MAPDSKVIVNWYKGRLIADHNTFLSRSPVELRSLGHSEELAEYEIYERLPKFLHKWRGYHQVFMDHLPAAPLPPMTGRYHSRGKWMLPSPSRSDGRRRLIAAAAGSVSGEIESADMLISSRSDEKVQDITLGGEVGLGWLQLKLPSLFHKSTRKQIEYVISPPKDPRVEVRTLQADEAREHLVRLESQWADGSPESSSDIPGPASSARSLPGDIADYFRDRVAGDATLICEIGPSSPLIVSVEIGFSDDLRSVLCLQVRDLETDKTTTTDPLFLTAARGKIVVSDLSPGLLGDDAQDLLQALSDFHGDQEELARSLDIDSAVLESRLGAAVNELGTSGLDDAVALFPPR
jgi:hypothetical protein